MADVDFMRYFKDRGNWLDNYPHALYATDIMFQRVNSLSKNMIEAIPY